jgi:hypothetical protein
MAKLRYVHHPKVRSMRVYKGLWQLIAVIGWGTALYLYFRL